MSDSETRAASRCVVLEIRVPREVPKGLSEIVFFPANGLAGNSSHRCFWWPWLQNGNFVYPAKTPPDLAKGSTGADLVRSDLR